MVDSFYTFIKRTNTGGLMSLASEIVLYINERKTTKQEALDKEINKAGGDDETLAKLLEKKAKLDSDYIIENWLDNAAKKAKQISMATHAVKFTHSGSKGTNILADNMGKNNRYVDTFSCAQPKVDAVGNAAALDVASLLQLANESGKSLLEYIKQNDSSPFQPITDNKQQIDDWMEGLSAALASNALSSHTLSKQVYFPVEDAPSGYHLLLPMYSSSLSNEIYTSIQHCKFSSEMKAVRDARKNNQYSEEVLIAYPNLASTTAGGSKPQNISQLNSSRRGLTYLLDARAPQWKGQLPKLSMTPIVFEQHALSRVTRPMIYRLAGFISAHVYDESTSQHRNKLAQKVDEIAESIINAAAIWRDLPSGWSDDYPQLSHFASRWLDPNNLRWHSENNDWREPLSAEFGLWLKDSVVKASKRDFVIGAGEANVWRQQFKRLLIEVY